MTDSRVKKVFYRPSAAPTYTAMDRKLLDLVVCPELLLSGYNVGDKIRQLAEPQGGAFAHADQAKPAAGHLDREALSRARRRPGNILRDR